MCPIVGHQPEVLLRYIILLSFLLSFPAVAQTQLYFEESQALTRATPTGNPYLLAASPTKPLDLAGRTSYRLTVCPAPGFALTGTGSVRLYLYHRTIMGTGRWGYRKELDQDITITGNVVDMCQYFGLRTDIRQGYLHPATIGVGVTGGSTVTLRVDPDNF